MEQHLYLSLAASFEKQIAGGLLKAGEKLPSIRKVSALYGVSKNTVIQAYLTLESRSLIISRPQSGFYVGSGVDFRLPVPDKSQPSALSAHQEADGLIGKVFQQLTNTRITQLSLSVPAPSFLPISKLNKCLSKAMLNLPSGGTGYGDIQGNMRLRSLISKRAFTWGGDLDSGDLVITAGVMNAISFALMALTKPGDSVAVESPVYYGMLQLAKHLGLRVIELPTHPLEGIDLQALETILPDLNALLLVTNFNNPLGSSMPEDRKKKLVEMITANQVPLIENDLYGEVYFGEKRPKPCKAFDQQGWVLWCGSFSKTLAPGYRVGWIAPGRYLRQVLRQKAFHSLSSTTLTQEAVAEFMENGGYDKHLVTLRKRLFSNREHFIQSIGAYFPEGTKVSRPQGGFVLWIECHRSINTAKLYEAAMAQGISIAPGRMFTLQDQFHHCMRLSFGLDWNERLEQKLQLLGKLVSEFTSPNEPS
ncbi:MAG: PLP-dependent aminotransferase family protein [Lunatimonas sp.]|uniref:aminotransferase-like domain-containing protein n=1 Tax=Lunatimonas sp. TaxID=2060141 RepID=UPI00263B8C9F|nr:PLP-dependent aminotransferase family protein [Lunatimonas sp.]MCC5936911.1 PLP-dependent aminotransferase family protein [Lunatimonas sp.]